MMHYAAFVVAVAACLLYADRSGWLISTGTQNVWALITRASMTVLLAAIAVAFLNLAIVGATFEPRHWFVVTALAGTVGGHLGMRANNSPPT